MIVEIQCLPKPSGTESDAYANVKAAITVVAESGLQFSVSALGTTLEGEPEEIWPLLQRVHEATLSAGADSVISVIKVAQWADGVKAAAPTMESLTDGYR